MSLASFHGKIILLEFMVPWCPHCQKMAPVLGKLYQQYGQNVIFITISGGSGATADDAAQFIRAYSVTWTVVYDSTNSVFALYGVKETPTFLLIDKNGQIAVSYPPGEVAYDTLAADLARLTS